ncbi:MAG: SRPBCC family protein [Sinimarinibacterium flocculans]|uniref:SRPBCC family protein n=1 Tax=Sinimarinibacterium flocculans TaxID=985250 RepID=UPI003C6311B0
MIEAEHSLIIEAPIAGVWDYVQDIRKWAQLFPGYQDCTVDNDDDSRWTLKVGAGGLVRTVKVQVHVDRWSGPEQVDFSFKLANEPVEGGGVYTARALGPRQTEITLKVRVSGSGPMAPMWEAVSRPLLPQLAKLFAGQLKTEIEQIAGIAPATDTKPATALWRWLQRLWKTLFSAGASTDSSPSRPAEIAMSEQNKQVVLKFIHAMGSSDGAGAIPCLDPEASTLAKGFGKFAGVRSYATMVGTIDAFKVLLPTGLRPEIKTVTAEGDRVVVEFEGNAVTSEGKPYCNHYCMVFTMRGGRIFQVNEYFCNILADETLWPLVEKMQAQIPASPATP